MILWLSPPTLIKSGTLRAVLSSMVYKLGVKNGTCLFNDLSIKTPALKDFNPKKMFDKLIVAQARKNLNADLAILKPDIIVINDDAALRVITGHKYSLSTVRGSLYYYNGIPCIVLDNHSSTRYRGSLAFAFQFDIEKIARWATGTQHNEPAFNFNVCKTVDEVTIHAQAAKNSTLVGTDTETAGGFITTISYTYDTKEGKLCTFVVPFYDPFAANGAYWEKEKDEIEVRKILRDLHASPVYKTQSNGTYDCAYEIMEGFPLVNYLFDTQNLMHCIWIEANKALHNVASYFNDHYTYWKDESNAFNDRFGKDRAGLEQYWRYNGMDSYQTWLGTNELAARIVNLPWALANYGTEFPLSVGPCLAGSLRGLKVDRNRHTQIMLKQQQLADFGREDMKALSNEPDFNVNSPYDVSWLLYDVMGAKATRLQRKGGKLGPRSTDEKVLKLMEEQGNFFLTHAIGRVLSAKKPAAVVSKYGNFDELCFKNGRFLSWHNAAGTETYRLNSGSCQFWTGTNAQNLQPFIQEMFIADPNYVFVDCDFSASDDWFIAHEAEDEDKIALLKSGKDVHCTHASVFFKRNYEEILAGYKKKEEWVVHPITGVRQASKKIAHGKNFRMQATMMYNLMGRTSAIATARALGYKYPERMIDKEFIAMCDMLCDKYDHPKTGMYKRIRPWQDETVVELKRNHNIATNAFGKTRKFFGSADDHTTQRELSAYYGQSGTSGNANRALNEIFYSTVDDGKLCLFLIQVHDSLKFLVHKSAFSKIAQIKTIMEKEITLKGRTFHVPVNVEVGLTDGKKMLPWRPDITYEEIVEHERKTYAEKFKPGEAGLLEALGKINFSASTLEELEQQLADFEQHDDVSEETDDLEIVYN